MSKVFSVLTVAAFVATTLYGDVPCKQPEKPKPVSCECLDRGMGLPMDQKCFPAAYNAPANISLKNCWDVSLYVSFIYWHVSQDAMFTGVQLPVVATNGSFAQVTPGTLVSPSFEYKPGFKVGIGFNTGYDDWTGLVEYTWMHQQVSSTSSTTAAAPFRTRLWAIDDFGHNTTATNFDNATSVGSEWKMHLDMLDAVFSRPFYQGKRITLAPFAGLRALWVRQNFNVNFNQVSLGTTALSTNMNSHSWAIGPVLGTLGHWFLGTSFRFEGKAEGALLYTRYTTIGQNEAVPRTATTVLSTSSSVSDLSALRPMVDLGVGFGWGSYFSCQDYYLDFSARYDFSLLWDQNVMVGFVNAMNDRQGTSGNLYMHGLTLTGRFDF